MNASILRLFLSAVALPISLVPVCARAAAGDLYVSDASGTIFKFTPAGSKSTFASGLNTPLGLAFDRKGNLFVEDSPAGTIYKFTPAGTRTIFASGLDGGAELAFDGSDNLFATSGTAIVKLAPSGTKSTFASIADVGGQAFSCLAFDSSGNLFAGINGPESPSIIVKFTPAGTRSTFASGVRSPEALAFDGSGNLFAADSTGTIFKFTFTSAGMTTFTSSVDGPVALAFDESGNLFVADAFNGTILKFTPNGSKSIFAAGLNQPGSLAFEPMTEKVRNISARGLVGTGENVLIGGFILGGNELNNNAVVIRAIGPSLSRSGITNPLQDPTLELHNASGAVIASNNNWQDTQKAQITSSGLAPTDARESAIYATLAAGGYTAIVRGVNDATGVALVEIYSLSK